MNRELNSKTIKQLRDICYKLQIATLKPTSKFYRADCADIKACLAKKSKAQIIETISRYSWEPSQEMMRKHCQFDGIFQADAGYR